MGLGYAVGSIAGVTLENTNGDPFKALILDGANLMTARAINNRVAAAGSLYTQSFAISAGIPFGVRFEFIDLSVLQSIIAAINAAIDDQSSFNVTLRDDLQEISVDAVPAGSAWLAYDGQRTNPTTVKGVTMRFLTA